MLSGLRLAIATLLQTCVLACSIATLDARLNPADARHLNWARAEDVSSLDPHSVNDSLALALNQQIYEPLLQRDSQGKTQAALAVSWTPTADPLVWEFRLRQGVVFHDGTTFSADDVIFSLDRARQNGSDFQGLLGIIETVSKVDASVIRIKTRAPTSMLPAYLTRVLIMSKAWTEASKAGPIAAPDARFKSFLNRNANGTGPFAVVSREPGLRTVLRRHDTYWGRAAVPLEITQLVYRPIRNDTERVRALLSGEVDFVQDVPVNERPKLQATPGFHVNIAPENRALFLGVNVANGGQAGQPPSPLADKRVRQAINIAINRQAIQRNVTLGQSIPTGIIAPPSVNGYTRQLDQIPVNDLAKAKALMAEAGLGAGVTVRLDCPNDLYIRDEAICRAVAAQLAPIGLTVEVAARSGGEHRALLAKSPPASDFFLMGWNATTFDSEALFAALYQTRTDKAGLLNATRYSNPDVDKLIGELAGQTDFVRRNQTIAQLWRIVQDDVIYVPLHLQTLAYAMKADIGIPSDIENLPKLKLVKFGPTQ